MSHLQSDGLNIKMSVCASVLLDVHQRNWECGVALPLVQCTNTRSMAFSLVEAKSESESGRRAEWQSGGEARWAERCLPVSWH